MANDAAKEFCNLVIAETLKNEKIEKYEFDIVGECTKEHYGSDIAFVKVKGEDGDGKKRNYDLMVKYGQFDQAIRDAIPIRRLFETEILIYSQIIPRYMKFQSEKGLPLLSFTAKCYLTRLTETREALVLDNLKTKGYTVHDRCKSMGLSHIKLLLEALAEWHALSFALKDKHKAEYFELIKNLPVSPLKPVFETFLGAAINLALSSLYTIFEEDGHFGWLDKLKRKLGNRSAQAIMLDLMDQVEDYEVILHGDCWSGNFMFKYMDESQLKPTKVKLVDFQISSVRSPIIDISHVIFAVSSGKELQHLDELVQFYYGNLSSHLKKLGSDPDKVFPMESFKTHWKKYATHGALLGLIVSFFMFLDGHVDFTKEEDFLDSIKKVSVNPLYRERVTNTARYFIEFDIDLI